MKTIKEIAEKWNEMYELVIAGAPDITNASWKRINDVFMIRDTAMSVALNAAASFVKEWDNLTADDMDEDKDSYVWMKCIADLLGLSSQDDYAFYTHNGEVGVLCELDAETIKAAGFESFNGVAFVPGYALQTLQCRVGEDEKPRLSEEDCYSGYSGCCKISVQECRNIENEERMLLGWWSDNWAKSDEFARMFSKSGEYTARLKERMDNGEISEAEARKEWNEAQEVYEDPIGCEDYSFDTIFLNY